MHLVDSHVHLDFPSYDADRAEILRASYAAGVRTLLAIGIGDGPHQMHRALDLAREFSGRPGTPAIYASAGIHPQEALTADAAALARLNTLAHEEKIIAIGEIGLDYYHAGNPPIAVQQAAFIAQMHIAAAARLPILLHISPQCLLFLSACRHVLRRNQC